MLLRLRVFRILIATRGSSNLSNVIFLCNVHSCTAKYVGEYCQHLNPCYTGPGPRCQNGGSCRVQQAPDSSPHFVCDCPVGYSASLCEIREANDCDSAPCNNGGTCVLKSLRDYQCVCAPGFTGKLSRPLPPESVDCLRFNALFCYSTGAQCESQDHCGSQPCHNGATCVSKGSGYTCECAPGFSGSSCSEDVIECKSHPCRHGKCINTHGSYT